MSQDEQDAIVGRTMRELREAKESLKRLKEEAARRGERIKDVGHYLSAYPEFMIKEGTLAQDYFRHQPQSHSWTDADLLAPDKVHELTEAIRTQITKISQLSNVLKGLGHSV